MKKERSKTLSFHYIIIFKERAYFKNFLAKEPYLFLRLLT